MATPFLGLNQYAGGDVVSYLDGGYNSDMSKIDIGVQNASQKADAVESEVSAIKAASDKNSADIVTLTSGLSSTNQNVTDLTNSVNLVKNDVFVQYTATLNSTTITISGSGGNSFYFIMPETFNTTFAYVVNGVICTLVNMAGTSFKNGQIAKGTPVFVRLIGTVMYAVGALESEGGVTPVDYAQVVTGSFTKPSSLPSSSYNLGYVFNQNMKTINLYGTIRFPTSTNLPANTPLFNLSDIPSFPTFTGTSTIYTILVSRNGGSSTSQMLDASRNGTSIACSVGLNPAIDISLQCVINYSFWN